MTIKIGAPTNPQYSEYDERASCQFPVYSDGKRVGSIVSSIEGFRYVRVAGSFIDFAYEPVQSQGEYHVTLRECVESLAHSIL